MTNKNRKSPVADEGRDVTDKIFSLDKNDNDDRLSDSETPALTLDSYYGESGYRIGCKQILMILISTLADCHVSACLFYFVFEASHRGWECSPALGGDDGSGLLSGLNGTTQLGNASRGCACPTRERVFTSSYTSPATEFNLVCERRSLAKLMTSAYFTGSIVGSLIGGHLGDRYGRKTVALTMWTLMAASMALTSLASSWQLYAVLRFLTGVGGGPVSGSLMVLCCEYVGAKWRSLVSSQIGFSMGSLFATLLTYLMSSNWRHLTLAMALSLAPLIPLAMWIMPESARLLLIQGRVDKAHAHLTDLARRNKMAVPDIDVLRKISDHERKVKASRKHHSMADLFRGSLLAKTLIVLLCWLAVSFVSFGLKSSISDITGNLYTNSIIGFAGSIPCRLVTILVTNSVGRRWCYVIVTSLVTVALVIVTVMQSTSLAGQFPVATSVVAMIGNAVSDGNWIVVNLFSTELYSTEIRNIAVGVVYMVSRTGASIAPFILLLDTIHKSVPYILFAVLEVLSMILSLSLPETRHRPLMNSAYSNAAPTPTTPKDDSDTVNIDL